MYVGVYAYVPTLDHNTEIIVHIMCECLVVHKIVYVFTLYIDIVALKVVLIVALRVVLNRNAYCVYACVYTSTKSYVHVHV